MNSNIINNRLINCVVILTAILWSMSACAQYENFDAMATEMAEGDVPVIKSGEVKKLLDEGSSVILLDAREQSEFEVSHLKNAKYVGYDYFKKTSVKDLPKDSKVIVYCSVGYRSCRIGEKLQDMGFTDVHNLYGGIFDWVNNGYPVVDSNNQPTPKVHSYNEDWGRWLLKGEKVH